MIFSYESTLCGVLRSAVDAYRDLEWHGTLRGQVPYTAASSCQIHVHEDGAQAQALLATPKIRVSL